MFHTLAQYDEVYLYLFDIFYMQWLYPACMALFEYTKRIQTQIQSFSCYAL